MEVLPPSLPHRSIDEWCAIGLELSISNNIEILNLMRQILNLLKLAKHSACRNIKIDNIEFVEVKLALRRYTFDPERLNPVHELVYGIAQSIMQMVESIIESNSIPEPSTTQNISAKEKVLFADSVHIKCEDIIDQPSTESNFESIEEDVKPDFDQEYYEDYQSNVSTGYDIPNEANNASNSGSEPRYIAMSVNEEFPSEPGRSNESLYNEKTMDNEYEYDSIDIQQLSKGAKTSSFKKKDQLTFAVNNSFRCPLCEVSCSSAITIACHFERKHLSLIKAGCHLKCEECHGIMNSRPKIIAHRNECNSNTITFHMPPAPPNRRYALVGEDSFFCHLCPPSSAAFSTALLHTFSSHLRRKHTSSFAQEGIKFQCSKCSYEIRNSRYVTKHSRGECGSTRMKMYRIMKKTTKDQDNHEDAGIIQD